MTIYRAEQLPQVEIKSKPHARARRLTLRRDARDGGFTVTHPKRVSKREIQRFINDHSDWIEKHYEPVATVDLGMCIPFRGVQTEIVEGDKRGVRFEDGALLVKSANPARSVASYLKTQAQLFAPDRVNYYADKLDTNVVSLRWRDPKTRWGSCDSNGVIMLSWRLVMAPEAVFDYVIAHEVAHRIEMNHSARYWAVVESIYPRHKEARAWLRNEGKSLQSILF